MGYVNEFVCSKVRFKFWNGKKIYTVEYAPGLRMWFVFDEETESDCLAKFELKKREKVVCNYDKARYYLNTYFDSIKSEDYATTYNF